MTKQKPTKIPLFDASTGKEVPDSPYAGSVVFSSGDTWGGIVVEQQQSRTAREADNLMYRQHVVCINVGQPMSCEFRKNGGYRRIAKRRGAISFFPSGVSLRHRTPDSTETLYAALDPVLVARAAEDLLDGEQAQFDVHRRDLDPRLEHLAMALREEAQAARPSEPLFGEALATALAVHLLREYAGSTRGLDKLDRAAYPAGLPRTKLLRAIDYIHDHLHTELTIAAIARSVSMSPYHFTRLFKQSTGRSPYQYVVEARVKKARELLISGDYTISDVALQAGFSDQSHLTRHIRRAYGTTPKAVLAGL
jgi:AraC family transcriptional regulator